MKTENLAGVFVPDVADITEFGHSTDEACFRHYHSVKCLVEGALGAVESAGDSLDDTGYTVRGLLRAFLESMEKAENTFDAVHYKPPVLTIEELAKKLGASGEAHVTHINGTEDDCDWRYIVKGSAVAAKKNGNGKAKGKAA